MPEGDIREQARAWVLLVLLFLAYVCSTVDRIIISLLVDPIKHSLGVSDTAISLLQGLAFLFIYSIAGIPMGLLVDWLNRTRLIAAAMAFWSVATAFCGMATGYTSLFLARAAVGIGEATLSPAAYSLISDSFPKERLGLAIGVLTCGGAMGVGLALLLGGYAVKAIERFGSIELPAVGVLEPWQATFLIVALPGIVIGSLIALLPEPPRRTAHVLTSGLEADEGGIWAFMRRNKQTLLFHHIAAGLSNAVFVGMIAWTATFLARVHGWPVAEVGFASGIAALIGGTIGLLGGGIGSDLALRYGAHMRLVVCAVAVFLGGLVSFAYPLVTSPLVAVALFGIAVMCAGVPFSAASATLQSLAPSQVRGVVTAVFFLSISMVGALGPTAIALVSDHLFEAERGLRYAMATVMPIGFVASGLFFLLSVRHYKRSVSIEIAEAVLEARRPGSWGRVGAKRDACTGQ